MEYGLAYRLRYFSKTIQKEKEPANFLEWKFRRNEKTSESEIESIQLSDGSPLDAESLKNAIKNTSGTSDPKVGERILHKIAKALSSRSHEHRINEASALLSALGPENPTEALLLGQFLALQDSGMKCLRLANSEEMLFQVEKLFTLATKLFNTANQTMQSLMKFRTGGQQTVQVLHVHNEGQAIVAQNLSSNNSQGGDTQKNSIEPHGSL